MPLAATVAYASARSSGVVSATPSVNEPQPPAWFLARLASERARNVMPSRCAMATAFCGPTCSSSQTKNVFTDRPKPVHMVRSPSMNDGLALPGHQYPSQLPGPLSRHFVFKLAGALKLVSSGIPASSAASMVNILNVEPAW